MLIRSTLGAVLLRLTGAMLLGLTAFSSPVMGQAVPSALTGKVNSAQEGAMEGVLVTGKREGSTIATTVVTNAQGQYSFPRDRLEPGRYSIQIRAAGYELPGPTSVDVTAQRTAVLDLNLRTTQSLFRQLSNGEWLHSIPGTDTQKLGFLGCVGCHTLERPLTADYNTAEMATILQYMSTFPPNAMPGVVQQLSTAAEIMARPPTQAQTDQAAYIGSINLSTVPAWEFPLNTLPRPTGKATQVIMTTYDLPRPLTMVHDAIMDADGIVWYDDFGAQYVGKLNPRTGEVVEYPVPELKPGFARGFLDISFGPDGRIYLGNMGQAQVVRFDPRTEVMETFPAPNWGFGDLRVTMVDPEHSDVDGKIWVNLAATPEGGNRAYQVDLETWEWTRVDYPEGSPSASAYDIVADLDNNMYGHSNSLTSRQIWKTDGTTLETKWIDIPSGDGGGRRGHVDSQNRHWWAQYQANRVAMFDPTTEIMTQWDLPTAWTNPYDAQFDDTRYVWTGSMLNDFVVRLDVETGEFTEYLLPQRTNIRRVNVVKSAQPSALWVGDNHGPKIVKVEPLAR